MADHLKPTVLSTESGFVTEMHDRINDTARLFDAADVPSSTNQPVGTQRINRSIASLQRWGGADWATFGGYIPSGTTMLFVQAAAPVGWTKLATHNNKALRIVSGEGGGGGGSVAFTTAFASKSVTGTIGSTTATGTMSGGSISSTTATGTMSGGSVGSTTLTTAQMPTHNVNLGFRVSHESTGVAVPGRYGENTGLSGYGYHLVSYPSSAYTTAPKTSSVGSGSSHGHTFTAPTYTQNAHGHTFTDPTYTQNAHGHTFTGTALDLDVQYVDANICIKD